LSPCTYTTSPRGSPTAGWRWMTNAVRRARQW
jgi:hypothetical protein